MGKFTKKDAYYSKKYPMNAYQKEAHRKAMNRTVEHFKQYNVFLTQKIIEKVLTAVHIYIMDLVRNMYKWPAKDNPNFVSVHFGYFRTIFPKTVIDMHSNGEFTDEEFRVIREELYKKMFDIYYGIAEKRKAYLERESQEQQSSKTVEVSGEKNGIGTAYPEHDV